MSMRIEKSFVLSASPHAVWEFLTDPYRVARCLPGAAITEKVDERTYNGTMTVKVGPVTANYKGKVTFERLDATERAAEIVASGQETRGKGGADMRMSSRVSEAAPGATQVTVTSEVNVVGVLAQFGRGMIEDVSDQVFDRFTQAMRAELEAAPAAGEAEERAAPPGEAPPLQVISLGASALTKALGRAAQRPVLWIALALLAALILWLWIR